MNEDLEAAYKRLGETSAAYRLAYAQMEEAEAAWLAASAQLEKLETAQPTPAVME